MATYSVVFLRHGESTWNLDNRFTGWTDVDLTEQGVQEAHRAGSLFREGGFQFDVVFTSVLKRAIRTMWIVLDDIDQMWGPVFKSWRLNERHYGALQGLNKAETAAIHGEEQVKIWRRSYAIPPPSLERGDERDSSLDPKYAEVPVEDIPLAESLALTVNRVLPFWESDIAPAIRSGKRVLVVAHGNSLRALCKYLEDMSEEQVLELNIPTGRPLVYELDENLRALSSRYLGDASEIEAAMNAVANQGKAK